jgi:hypothetical protein
MLWTVVLSGCTSELTMVVDDEGPRPDAGAVVDAGTPSGDDAGVVTPVDAGSVEPVDAGNACAPCVVAGPGHFCGLDVGITPFVTGGPFGGFQSDVGTGASHVITVTLSAPINWVSVVVLDPDFQGNKLEAYDAQSNLVSEVDFPGDGTPNVLTQTSMGTGGGHIVRVELIPAPLDYVAYEQLQIIPEGCAAPNID